MYVCTYVRMYVCMYVCMYVYIHVYIYIYTYVCFPYQDPACLCVRLDRDLLSEVNEHGWGQPQHA